MDIKTLKTLYTYLAQLTAEAIAELRKDKNEALAKTEELKGALVSASKATEQETVRVKEAIEEVNQTLKTLIEATNASKTDTISVDNLSDAKTDLSPLERNFEALKASMEGVKEAIQSIKPAQGVDFSKVEEILKQIAKKEHKEDMSYQKMMVAELKGLQMILEEMQEKQNEDISITLKIV
jgi:hypothetical protein